MRGKLLTYAERLQYEGYLRRGEYIDQTPNFITINVTPVNDAPVSADASHTVNEDAVFNFSADMFGFSDPNDNGSHTLSRVIIDDIDGKGHFMLGKKAVVEGQKIDADDLYRLTVKGDRNGFGDNYASLEFTVADDGGTANGCRNTAEESNRLTFDLVDVVDTFNGGKGKDRLTRRLLTTA
ncbi:MAG: outer rane adhesin like protein [Rhizobium sp.]|nr:outer rane adhesin like protein [Rhizobium sp.]